MRNPGFRISPIVAIVLALFVERLPALVVYTAPVIQLDFLPNALAAAEIEAQPHWKLDGVNLPPYLTDGNRGAPHNTFDWRLGEQMAVRNGEWKLVRYDLTADSQQGSAVTSAKLYDLAADIGEAFELSAANAGQGPGDRGSMAAVEPAIGPTPLRATGKLNDQVRS
jgi:arylsulfatase A-like enzyme